MLIFLYKWEWPAKLKHVNVEKKNIGNRALNPDSLPAVYLQSIVPVKNTAVNLPGSVTYKLTS